MKAMKVMMKVMYYVVAEVLVGVYLLVNTYKNIKKAEAKTQFVNVLINQDTPSEKPYDVFNYCYGDLGGYKYNLGYDVINACYGNL